LKYHISQQSGTLKNNYYTEVVVSKQNVEVFERVYQRKQFFFGFDSPHPHQPIRGKKGIFLLTIGAPRY